MNMQRFSIDQHIPNWFTVSNKKILTLQGFFEGESTLYTPEHLNAWLGPVLLWSAITVVLFQILLCINSIQRLQWTERERLSYPIVQLPIEMTRPDFLRNKLLWASVPFSGSIEILNGSDNRFIKIFDIMFWDQSEFNNSF